MGLVKTTSGKLLVVLKESAGEVIRQLENGLFKVKLMSQEGVRYVIDNLTLLEMQPLLAATGNGFANLRGQLARIDLGDYGIRAAIRELTGISDELLEALLQKGLSESQLARLADNLVFGKNPQLFKHLLESTEGLTKKELEDFANDLLREGRGSKGNELLQVFKESGLDPRAWKVLKLANRTDLVLTKEALSQVQKLLLDEGVHKAFGPNFADELVIVCKSYNGFKGIRSLVAHLEDVRVFCNKFQGVEGIETMLASMKSSNGYVQDGLDHVLIQLNRADFDASKVKRFDMEFEGEGLPCKKCRFDVEMVDGYKPKLIEYKSYLDASKIQLPQFLNYIASISSLNDLKYVFNKSKLSIEEAKAGMKIFIKANKPDIFLAMPTSIKTELGISLDALELSNSQIEAIVNAITDVNL